MGFMGARVADADVEAMIYSTMNSDHMEMFQMIAQLRDGATLGWDRHRIIDQISRLMTFSKAHFRREEALMERFLYPGTAEHKRQHMILTRQAEAFMLNLSSGCQGPPAEVAAYFRRWVTDHIRTTDKELERFLAAPMRSAAA